MLDLGIFHYCELAMQNTFARFLCCRFALNGYALRRVGALVVLCMGVAAWADPPIHAGRVAEVVGNVWQLDTETRAWVKLGVNQSVGRGDVLRTDARAHLTMRVGSSTFWLSEQSDLEVLQLDSKDVLLRLARGELAMRLRSDEAAQETRVQTREGLVGANSEGLFRIDQLERGTRITALQGQMQFDADPGAPAQRVWLREGERAWLGWAEAARVERISGNSDTFGAWLLQRDQAEFQQGVGVVQYVSPEMTGAEDLGRYGIWEESPEYGTVWYPNGVAANWEPYRDGRWAWTSQWGWSWVDNAPWGFAPFHYGRWVQYGGRWAWTPGRLERRPSYAPALVQWSGDHGRVAIGIGQIAPQRRVAPTHWMPLAPQQRYMPTHSNSPQYLERFRWDRDVVRQVPHNERPVAFDPWRNEPRSVRPNWNEHNEQRGGRNEPTVQRPAMVAPAPSFPMQAPNVGNPNWERRDTNQGHRPDERQTNHQPTPPLAQPNFPLPAQQNSVPMAPLNQRHAPIFNPMPAAQSMPPVQQQAPAQMPLNREHSNREIVRVPVPPPIFQTPPKPVAPVMTAPTPQPAATPAPARTPREGSNDDEQRRKKHEQQPRGMER